MQRYEHGGDPYPWDNIRLDFSVNINPLGMPVPVREAIMAHMDEYQSYPDPHCRRLCDAIAAQEGVAAEHVLCGNGANDLIYRLCLGQKPKRTLLLAPTFSEYEKAALLAGSQIVYHRLWADEDFTLTERILDGITPEIEMLFLCNPNNPTGQLTKPELVEKIIARCAKMRVVVVVDQCFMAFTDGRSCTPLLTEYPNLVIIDAFTKRYAMAGLRLGYLLTSNRAILEAARDWGPCWNVSAVAQAAGLAALGCDDDLEQARRIIRSQRRYLSDALKKLNLRVFPSHANYILFQCKRSLVPRLCEQGIFIRSCANYEGLDDSFYRICVKGQEENTALIKALWEVCND